MSKENLSIDQILHSLRLSVLEGTFANIFGNLTGSVFLPSFALALGANPLQIGLLASIPFFANLAQLAGSYLVERTNQRKRFAILFGLSARMLWIPIVLLSLLLSQVRPATVLTVLIFVIVGYNLLGSMGGVAWLTWMMALVPEEVRGRYFGLRNAVLGATALSVTLLGGRFLDSFTRTFPEVSSLRAFDLLFAFAIAAGIVSILIARKQSEPTTASTSPRRVADLYSAPLHNAAFQRLSKFALLWSFSVNIASPFFLVYMLQDLKLSYTAVAAMTVTSALADLIGMWVWGHASDHIGNKPVMVLATIVASALPLVWLFTGSGSYSVYLMIPLLHLFSGFFWAGYNLCSANLVFRIVPKEGTSVFFAFWSSYNGLAAGCGAVAGGLLARFLPLVTPHLGISSWTVFKAIFLISGLLRVASIPLLRPVHEPRGMPVGRAVRVLRNVKSWATVMGFHPALNFFVPSRKPAQEASPYWPLWRRRPVSPKSVEEMPR